MTNRLSKRFWLPLSIALTLWAAPAWSQVTCQPMRVDQPLNPAIQDHHCHDHAFDVIPGQTWVGLDLTDAWLFFAILDSVTASCGTPGDVDCTTLSGADLSFASIEDADFSGASFSSLGGEEATKLFDAELDRSIFEDVDFRGAILESADLSGVVADGAFFNGADLSFASAFCVLPPNATNVDDEVCPSFVDADFSASEPWLAADLSYAILREATLTQADFSGATLDGASLELAKIPCADVGPNDPPLCVNFDDASLRFASLSGSDFENASFVGADLHGAVAHCVDLPDLEETVCASFINADFTPAAPPSDGSSYSLMGADFTGSVVAGAIFVGADLSDAVFSAVELCRKIDSQDVCADFTGAVLAGTNLSDVEFIDMPRDFLQGIADDPDGPAGQPWLSKAVFDRANLEGVDLHGANLRDASFIGAFLTGANLDGADLTGAALQNIDLLSPCDDFTPIGGGSPQEACASFASTLLVGASLVGSQFDAVTFSGASIDAVDFGSALLADIDFSDVTFNCASAATEPCTLPPDAAGIATAFTNATFHTVDFSGADLRNVDFTGLRFDSDCAVDCVDFMDAQLAGAVFVDVDLSGTQVPTTLFQNIAPGNPGPNLQEVDFSGSNLEGLDLSGIDLRGAQLVGTSLDAVNADLALFGDPSLAPELAADLRLATARCTSDDTCASFQGTEFSGADLSGAGFTGADLSSAIFEDADLLCITSDDSTICTDFGSTNLVDADFTDAAVEGLQLNDVEFGSVSSTIFDAVDTIEGDDEVTRKNMRGVDFGNAEISNLTFDGYDLSDAGFEEATICVDPGGGAPMRCVAFGSQTLLEGARFAQVDFSNAPADFFHAIAETDVPGQYDLSRVDFSSADIGNLDFNGAGLEGAIFSESNICADSTQCESYGGFFSGATLDRATFSTSEAPFDFGNFPADFLANAAGLEGLVIRYATLDGLDFSNTNMQGADLSFASVRSAKFVETDLGNAILDNLVSSNYTQPCGSDCPDFNDAMLNGASLRSIDFTRIAILDEIDPNLTPLGGEDDREFTDFSFAILDDLDISRLTLTDARFVGSSLTGIDFTQSQAGGEFFQNLAPAEDPEDDSQPMLPSVTQSNLSDAIVSSSSRPMNLQAVDLRQTNLTGTDFDGAVMTCVDPLGDDEICTDLTGATLTATRFTGATLAGAIFAGLVLDNPCRTVTPPGGGPAELECIDFSGADLAGSKGLGVPGVRLTASDWTSVSESQDDLFQSVANESLQYATLGGSQLWGFDFTDMNLSEIDTQSSGDVFCGQDASGNRECATLTGVDFSDAQMQRIDLANAPLVGARFAGADLRAADLSGLLSELDAACSGDECIDFTNTQMDSIFTLDTDLTKLGDPNVFQNIATTADEDEPRPAMRGSAFITSNLSGLNLSGFDLSGSIFQGSDFTDANLSDADLTPVGNFCDFDADTGERIDCANLTRADLSNVVLLGADLEGVEMTGAILRGADLRVTRFNGQSETCLETGTRCLDTRGAILRESSMADVDFTTYDPVLFPLEGRDLRSIFFEGAILSGRSLAGSDLAGAAMSGADLTQANLRDSDFSSVDFADGEGACAAADPVTTDLRGANLYDANFEDAPTFQDGCIVVDRSTFYSAGTRLPPGFTLLDQMTKIDLGALAGKDLTGGSFTAMDLGASVFDGSELAGVNFSRTILASASFDDADFAAGAASCDDYTGAPADFRGADLRATDLATATTFQTGCIVVDSTTLYSDATRFPPGFDPIEEIPEPASMWLQIASLCLLARLALHRRRGRAA